MGYNGNHRKPHNVWKPSLFKRGMRMIIPKPRKPRKYVYRQNKAAQSTFTAQRYNLPSESTKSPTGEEKRQKSEKWSCVVFLIPTIAVLALIGWVFGWEWSFIIPVMLIIFMFIQN